MKKHPVYIVGALLFGVLLSRAPAQNANYQYVEEPINPRSVGMSGTGTAQSSGGFAFYNPAGAATAQNSFVGFEYGQQWGGDLTRGLVEGAYVFPRWFFGASFQTQGVSIPKTDDVGSEVLGETNAQESQFTLLTGWHKDRYAVGLAVNGLQHHIDIDDAFALSVSGGITVLMIPGKLAAGAALLHAGGLHRGFFEPAFKVGRNLMPTTARFGGSWEDTLFGKLPVTLQIDAVYSTNHSLLMVPAGVEIRPITPLAIRIGKRFNHPTDIMSCGIGVFWENLSYNLAFVPTNAGDIELKWVTGLTYSLAKRKKQARKTVQQQQSPAPSATSDTAASPTMAAPVPEAPDTPADITEIPAPRLPDSAVPSSAASIDTAIAANPEDSLNASSPGQSSDKDELRALPHLSTDSTATVPVPEQTTPAAPSVPTQDATATPDDTTQLRPAGETETAAPPPDGTAPQR